MRLLTWGLTCNIIGFMSGQRKFGATSNPLIVIEWIIAIVSFIGGVYLLSPLLNVAILVNMNSPVAAFVASSVGIVALGVVLLFSALLLIAGIVKRRVKWRSAALFINGLTRFYALVATLAINGPMPLTWLSSFALLLITFYVWGRIRKRGIE